MSELSERLREMSLHKRIRPGSEAAPWVCDEVEKLEARVKELEAINLGLVKTLLEEGSEKSRLVGALEELVDLMGDTRQGDYIPDSFTTQPARIALATYRKKGDE